MVAILCPTASVRATPARPQTYPNPRFGAGLAGIVVLRRRTRNHAQSHSFFASVMRRPQGRLGYA